MVTSFSLRLLMWLFCSAFSSGSLQFPKQIIINHFRLRAPSPILIPSWGARWRWMIVLRMLCCWSSSSSAEARRHGRSPAQCLIPLLRQSGKWTWKSQKLCRQNFSLSVSIFGQKPVLSSAPIESSQKRLNHRVGVKHPHWWPLYLP